MAVVTPTVWFGKVESRLIRCSLCGNDDMSFVAPNRYEFLCLVSKMDGTQLFICSNCFDGISIAFPKD